MKMLSKSWLVSKLAFWNRQEEKSSEGPEAPGANFDLARAEAEEWQGNFDFQGIFRDSLGVRWFYIS